MRCGSTEALQQAFALKLQIAVNTGNAEQPMLRSRVNPLKHSIVMISFIRRTPPTTLAAVLYVLIIAFAMVVYGTSL
jgi:hypothetical protein